jgi:hypothetical protein
MRPFDSAVATAPAVGPVLASPHDGGAVHGLPVHVVVDSVLGIVVGVVLVVLYLAVLRRLGRAERTGDERRSKPRSDRESRDS